MLLLVNSTLPQIRECELKSYKVGSILPISLTQLFKIEIDRPYKPSYNQVTPLTLWLFPFSLKSINFIIISPYFYWKFIKQEMLILISGKKMRYGWSWIDQGLSLDDIDNLVVKSNMSFLKFEWTKRQSQENQWEQHEDWMRVYIKRLKRQRLWKVWWVGVDERSGGKGKRISNKNNGFNWKERKVKINVTFEERKTSTKRNWNHLKNRS